MRLPTEVRCTFCKREIKDGDYYSSHVIGDEELNEVFVINQCEACESRWVVTNDGGTV